MAGHLVLYIYIERLHGTKYLSSKGRKDEFASWLKMPPFSTDIDPRRCSSRDYTRLDLDSLLSQFPPSDGGEGGKEIYAGPTKQIPKEKFIDT